MIEGDIESAFVGGECFHKAVQFHTDYLLNPSNPFVIGSRERCQIMLNCSRSSLAGCGSEATLSAQKYNLNRDGLFVEQVQRSNQNNNRTPGRLLHRWCRSYRRFPPTVLRRHQTNDKYKCWKMIPSLSSCVLDRLQRPPENHVTASSMNRIGCEHTHTRHGFGSRPWENRFHSCQQCFAMAGIHFVME